MRLRGPAKPQAAYLFLDGTGGDNQFMSVASVLGPRGSIAKLWPEFEARREQLDMAEAVADAIAGPNHLMVEAGTGVGKSFAYLVPAIQAALAIKDCRVVISTHTISLQEQLLRKDIPFLQSVMPQEFRVALVKGRANYLSKRRLRVAQQKMLTLAPDRTAGDQLVQIGKWAKRSEDGSKSDLPFVPQPAVWDLVESEHGNCLGRNCPDHAECFYFRSRRGMLRSKVLPLSVVSFGTPKERPNKSARPQRDSAAANCSLRTIAFWRTDSLCIHQQQMRSMQSSAM